jgi:hypothetical protein
MHSELTTAIEHSDLPKAQAILKSPLSQGQINPLSIHETLFLMVQRVLDPLFSNSHLSKIYAIKRELILFLKSGDIPRCCSLKRLKGHRDALMQGIDPRRRKR